MTRLERLRLDAMRDIRDADDAGVFLARWFGWASDECRRAFARAVVVREAWAVALAFAKAIETAEALGALPALPAYEVPTGEIAIRGRVIGHVRSVTYTPGEPRLDRFAGLDELAPGNVAVGWMQMRVRSRDGKLEIRSEGDETIVTYTPNPEPPPHDGDCPLGDPVAFELGTTVH